MISGQTVPNASFSIIPEPTARSLPALLKLGRPLVMGILNVTPDSFSDGGQFFEPQRAIDHAREFVKQGADIIDIGAESTRPYGAKPVSADEELARLAAILPSVTALGLPVSIDTMKANVAAWALDAGASIVNDIWGLQGDPHMASLVAMRRVPIIIMHNRSAADENIDIIADMFDFFKYSLGIAERCGIARETIVLDPGIGFGKTPTQSMICLARLGELKCFELPILVGASRKRFIDSVVASSPSERIGGSIASHLIAVEKGASIVRVHDVKETVQALRIAAAIEAIR
jgi:dihydropteroate synthase